MLQQNNNIIAQKNAIIVIEILVYFWIELQNHSRGELHVSFAHGEWKGVALLFKI